MDNKEVAHLLFKISILVDILEDGFKPSAYRRAARVIEEMPEDINKVKDLESILGVGEGIAKKIRDMLRLEYSPFYEKLKKKIPIEVDELINIPNIGPSKIKRLYLELGIKNKKELLKAAKEHKIRELYSFGEKTEQEIIENIDKRKKTVVRKPLFVGIVSSNKVISALKATGLVERISVGGSVRRKKDNIGDIDIVATTSKPVELMSAFVSLSLVKDVVEKGETKSSIRMHNNLQVDLRVVDDDCYGSALQHFTGSKDHNILLRRFAQKKGIKLNEYGIFEGKKRIGGKNEEEIYKVLGMDYIPPELREGRGEIEAAIKGKLPKLVDVKDLKGDLHIHSFPTSQDSSMTIEQIAEHCKKLGYSYIAISDHIHSAKDIEQFKRRSKEVDDLNSTYSKFKILKGVETDIRRNGRLSLPQSTFKHFDLIIASVHSGFNMSKDEMTERLVKALSNEGISIFGHPTSRMMFTQPPIEYDKDKIFSLCADKGIALEIDSNLFRLDLNDINILLAKEHGAKFSIDSDAHKIDDLDNIVYGIYTARRGWLTKKDIINCGKI